MAKVTIEMDEGDIGAYGGTAHCEGSIDALAVAHLCVQAMLAAGFHPDSVAEAFWEIGDGMMPKEPGE